MQIYVGYINIPSENWEISFLKQMPRNDIRVKSEKDESL